MAALAKVIRNTRRNHLLGLFQSVSVNYPARWENPDIPHVQVLNEFQQLPAKDQEAMKAVTQRIQHLSEDDLGQDILMAQASDPVHLKSLDNPYDRAAWVFNNDSEVFKKAEHYYFHDAHRNSRMWEGYRLQNPSDLDTNKLHGPFQQKLKEYFGNTDEVLIEVYDRELVDSDESHIRHQVMIYREGLPSIVNELGKTSLNTRIIKPVRESAVTWDPKLGEMEVVSSNQDDRRKVARLFAAEVIGDPDTPDVIPLKQYDLEKLRFRPTFDSNLSDGIASVAVTLLTMKSKRTGAFFTVKSPNRKGHEIDVYDAMMEDDIARLSSRESFEIHSARLSVEYRPNLDDQRTRTLSFDITMPNKCNLKDKKHIEQKLNNELLERWGLLKEVE